MKNILLFSALLCIAFNTQAQFTTGQKMIGGAISGGYSEGASSTSSLTNRQTVATLGLSFSKFKSPTEFRSIGVFYGYSHSTNGTGQFTSNANSVGIFLERTKLQLLARRFYFTYAGGLYASGQFIKNTDPVSGGMFTYTKNNLYSISLNGNIGLLYHLNDRFLFTCNLINLLNVGFTHSDSKTSFGAATATSRNNSFSFTTGLSNTSLASMSIGAKYMLKKQ